MKNSYKIFIALFVLFSFLITSNTFAKAHPNLRKAKNKGISLQSAEETPGEIAEESEIDADNGKYAATVNQNVQEIQEQIQTMAKDYKSGSVWQKAQDVSIIRKDSKFSFLRYPLMVPTYVLRAATWPIAVSGNYLIEKGVVTKVVNIVSNKARTFWIYPKTEMGFGSGFGLGVGMRHLDLFHKNYKLYATYMIHINLNHEAHISLKKPEAFYLIDRPFIYKLYVNFIRHLDQDFYGIGQRTSQNMDSKYEHNEVKYGGWLKYDIFDNAAIRINSFFIWDLTGDGRGGTSVTTRFPLSSLPAFGQSLHYYHFELALISDTKNSEVAPESGGLRSISFHRFQGLNTTSFDYNEYRANVSQYIPVLMTRHVLALRAEMRYQQQTGRAIPFYRLTKIDIISPVRGFGYGRFTDRGRIVLNAEYRFPIWEFLDGTLFVDSGRVFHSPGDFSFKHLRFAGGGGLSLRTKNYFLGRFQIGYGGEGVNLLIRMDQAF